jgi:two-component system, sensor histidine kinase and response regulator
MTGGAERGEVVCFAFEARVTFFVGLRLVGCAIAAPSLRRDIIAFFPMHNPDTSIPPPSTTPTAPTAPTAPAASVPSTAPPPTALIVDDVVQNIEVLGIMLREHAIKVIGATSAQQALRVLETTKPDIILLDIQMPDMDGFEACERIKANPDTKDIPVIFLTARTDIADIVRGFGLGAVDFVNKPFQVAELLARVRAHVELKQLRDAALRNNAALQSANERLQSLDQEKNELLGIVVHDLKNPLANIIFAADILEQMDESFTPEQRLQRVSQIRTVALYMSEITSNLLDINVIESGKLALYPELHDITKSVEHFIPTYRERANAKNITLNLALPSEPLMVFADSLRTREIIENLLSNAVKYSPEGKQVWLSFEKALSATTGAPTGVQVVVRDEGPGLTSEDKERLFGKFARLSAKPTGGEQSTGLGLSIVKKLVEAMNGRVWCESEHGKGATFRVELPHTKQ